mmetsp:Transcript_34056/g.71711  ORF Transcript_34056/g.71711 Transcript_34056/m.71711 type:complete len:117 (-) Transcript_34056:731-1081(-)
MGCEAEEQQPVVETDTRQCAPRSGSKQVETPIRASLVNWMEVHELRVTGRTKQEAAFHKVGLGFENPLLRRLVWVEIPAGKRQRCCDWFSACSLLCRSRMHELVRGFALYWINRSV